MMDLSDTICALSTPPGRSGIAVVRVSGSDSHALYRRIFRANHRSDVLPSRIAVLGHIVDPRDGSDIDEAIAMCFATPQSYTGEDMTEYSLHGSPVLIAALLDCLCAVGARLAEPGEFTMRAFLHGRLDLAQAEAVKDIIDATTVYQAQVAARQYSGSISQQLRSVKDVLTDIIVNLESAVEFVEEELPLDTRETLMEKLAQIQCSLRRWIESYRQGRIVRDGFTMAIVGRPNVGKSSIFNALLAQNRSIVTEIPGTTRDLVSEFTNIGGVPVRLLDTAGIRGSDDHIERLGIDRSMQAIADADVVLLVVDTSRPQTQEDLDLKQQILPLPCVVLLHKADLPSRWSTPEREEFAGSCRRIATSAKTGAGIGELSHEIMGGVIGTSERLQDGIMVTNFRHCHYLEATEANIVKATEALRNGWSEEFVLIDLHAALKNLGAITGETGVEDLLTEIFSRFCIGK
jgi:tRNA modification GTPase